jgi:hypothetical protein
VKLPVFVRPLAELDLLEAQRWYDGQRRGLGAEFRKSADLVFSCSQNRRSSTRSSTVASAEL